MFLQEARIAAQINHPNVVQIYHLASDGGLPYIAMEFVDGSTLKELGRAAQSAGRVVPIEVGVAIAIQACAGAHAAHELTDTHGNKMHIVHRDLSPHNLMVTAQGHVKVLDFGIAKANQGVEKTRTGVLKGKISYLSPEQCMQEDIDRRSDLFTLAGVIYELLCFEKPFQGKSDLNTMQNIVKGNRGSMGDHRPDAPDELIHILEKALATDPDQRFIDADEMRRALIHVAQVHNMNVDLDTVAGFLGEVIGPEHLTVNQDLADLKSSIRSLQPVQPNPRQQQRSSRLNWLVGILSFFVSTAVMFLLLVLIFQPSMISIQLPTREPFPYTAQPSYTGDAVQFRLAPTIDEQLLLDDFEPIRRYLSHKLQRPVEMTVGDSYEDAAQSILNGSADLALLPPFIYTQTHDKDARVRVIATKVDGGSTGSDSVLLVRSGNDIQTLSDLRGLTICHSDENSTTSYVLPRAHLRKNGVDPDKEMKAHVSGNHLQVVRDILANTCDVGAIYTGAFQSAEAAGVDVAALRMLGIAGRTPHDALVVGPNTDPELERQLLAALLELNPERDLGLPKIGKVEHISGFAKASDALYDPLREAIGLSKKQNDTP